MFLKLRASRNSAVRLSIEPMKGPIDAGGAHLAICCRGLRLAVELNRRSVRPHRSDLIAIRRCCWRRTDPAANVCRRDSNHRKLPRVSHTKLGANVRPVPPRKAGSSFGELRARYAGLLIKKLPIVFSTSLSSDPYRFADATQQTRESWEAPTAGAL